MLLSLSILQTAWAANVSVSIDRNPVNAGESFQLIYTLDGNADNISPDFSPLETNFTKTQWLLTLMAKSTGTLNIPTIQFGQMASKPIALQVLAANANNPANNAADAYLKVSVNQTTPYVQSQVLYTVKLFYAVSISNGTLTDPKADNAIIMSLGDDKRYQSRQNGRLYQVLERNYAIFPQNSGTLKITAPLFSGLVETDADGNSGFNSLMQDGRPINFSSEAETLNVKAIPANINSSNWLPASNIQIKQSWSDNLNALQIGKPITRTIIITAHGLAAAQLPVLSFDNGDGYNVYADKPHTSDSVENNQIVGQITQKIAYIPNKPGAMQLPSIQINWWNTDTNVLSNSVLPEQKLVVTGNPVNTQQTNNQTPVATAPPTINKMKPIKAIVQQQSLSKPAVISNQNKLWLILTIILVGACLITILIWRAIRNKNKIITTEKKPETIPAVDSIKRIRTALKNACTNNQSDKARDLLITWANNLWPAQHFRSLGAITKYIEPDALANQIMALEKELYSGSSGNWQGKHLYQAFADYKPGNNEKKSRHNHELPELYPS